MNDTKKSYVAMIEIAEDELNAIFYELEKAKETIYGCYNKLQDMGLVKIIKAEPPAATDGSKA